MAKEQEEKNKVVEFSTTLLTVGVTVLLCLLCCLLCCLQRIAG